MRIQARYSFQVILCLNALLAVPAQANLIVNGGFDSNANGWTVFPVAGDNLWRSIGGNPGGNQRLNSNGSALSDPYIEQTVSGLSIGTSYVLNWDLSRDFGTSTSPTFGVFLDPGTGSGPNGTSLFLFTDITSTAWLSQQTSFVATAASHTIRFAAELDTRTPGTTLRTDVSYWIDNVSLLGQQTGGGGGSSAVPEPSTWVTLAAGGAMALTMRRRRHRLG